MPSHQDFVLPGIRADPTNLRLNSLIVLAAIAYSREWNRRRLESHWYGLWNQILTDLLFDLAPNLLLVPQHTIYLSEDEPCHPDLSIGTVAIGDANERIPDFVALVAAVKPRNGGSVKDPTFPPSYSSWNTMQVIAGFPAMIVQVKRSPPRSLIRREDFIDALNIHLRDAADEADDSAVLTFSNRKNRRLRTIVLVAVSGEWWRFKIGFRDNYRLLMNAFSDQGSESEGEEAEKKKKKKVKGGEKRKGLLPKTTDFQRHEDLGPAEMERLESDVNRAKPRPGKWSKTILFGTPASNQRLYLIHELLKDIQRNLINEVGEQTEATSKASSEDELAGYDVPF